MLGTAILIAIVGEPATLAAAGEAADEAYVFGIGAALLSGAVALRLRPAREARGVRRDPVRAAVEASGS